MAQSTRLSGWRERLHVVIFEADTPAGKRFDVALLWAILLSVAAVLAESVELIAVRRPLKYAWSFYGWVDLLSILPTFVEVLVPGAASLRIVRMLRLLRVFRVLKLVGFLQEAQTLRTALYASRRKIVVFLSPFVRAVRNV